ncbi:membrane protein insertase YidC [Desulfohalovibrio reitneri]|uniref:membrane protein insertase YidC n=1 Tax=Desulfohalovibrio reitneri TaxID=1307759 RepID=UPI0004A76505|nr:membrane protein insertase YidC [Desulfohalovibrio reitneri]
MDSKRVVIATALSFVIILVWSLYFSPEQAPQPQQPQQQQAQRQADPGADTGLPATQPDRSMPEMDLVRAEGERITVNTPLYKAVLNTGGGLLERFSLRDYKESIKPNSADVDLVSESAMAKAPLGLIWIGRPTWTEGKWSFDGSDLELSGDETGTMRLVCDLPDARLVRSLTFHADSYLVEEDVRVISRTEAPLEGRLAFTLASSGLAGDDSSRYNNDRIAWLANDSMDEEDDEDDLREGLLVDGDVRWGGLGSNYFLLALAPETSGAVFKAKRSSKIYRLAAERSGISLPPGGETTVSNSYYLGPKSEEELAAAGHGLGRSIDYGFLHVIAAPLVTVLKVFHGFVGNWGVAIILLTIVIKIIFWPLSQKSYKSMEKMKKIQPMMTKLREKYKDDREQLNKELMQLYKTYKVNPAGGCLPMLLQIPVFIGLYEALLTSIELRHAAFIEYVPFTDLPWLVDLSARDPYFVTPLIMGATMFLQQKMTPSPGDPTQAKIMMLMPVVFTGLFLTFPAGLVVYWLTNNVLSIAQQWMIRRSSAA